MRRDALPADLTIEVREAGGRRFLRLRRGGAAVEIPREAVADLVTAVLAAATRPRPYEAPAFGASPHVLPRPGRPATGRRSPWRGLPELSPAGHRGRRRSSTP